jgi:hypothetical protein
LMCHIMGRAEQNGFRFGGGRTAIAVSKGWRRID